MAIIRKTNNNKHWCRCRKKGTYTLLVEMKISAATMGISMDVPQKSKGGTAICSTISCHISKGI
jgi:hypothetical protein